LPPDPIENIRIFRHIVEGVSINLRRKKTLIEIKIIKIKLIKFIRSDTFMKMD